MRLHRLVLPALALLLAACPTGRGDDDDVDGDLPGIVHEPVTAAPEGSEVPLTAVVTPPTNSEEDLALVVTLFYRAIDGGSYTPLPMQATESADEYGATIPAEVVSVEGVEYYISAAWGSAVATHPGDAPATSHRIVVSAGSLTDPAPLRARYDTESDTVELTWTPSLTSAFAGYSVIARVGVDEPVTVCQGGDIDGACSVPADGLYDGQYADWTVTVADGDGNGLSASAVTDGLHLLLAAWGREATPEDPVPFGNGQSEFFLPFGIAVHESSVHIAEQSNHRLQTLTDEGTFLGFVGALGGTGTPGDGPGEFDAPHDVVVGPDGDLYVADHTNARVQVFDGTTRQFVRDFGGIGLAEGELRFPVSLAFDGDGNLHVAESVNARISIFAADGTFLSAYSEVDGEALEGPSRIEYLPLLGVMAISDRTVVRLRSTVDGEPDATWDLSGELSGDAVVSGVCGTEYGEAIVTLDDPEVTAGSDGHRLIKVDADGVAFDSFGEWGVSEGLFWRPVDCTVSDAGELWIADGLNHRVQLFGP